MKELVIFKYAGTKNSFFIVDLTWQDFEEKQFGARERFAVRICNGELGHEADGLFFLETSSSGEISWDFYNRDGSRAEMCGNAARCATLYWSQAGRGDGLKFKTLAGWIEGKLNSDFPSVKLSEIKSQGEWVTININGLEQRGFYVNTGVPHFVIHAEELSFSKEWLKKNIFVLGKDIRNHAHFSSKGTNVTFLSDKGQRVKTITFERGVEDFTLSCGTGAVAAALSLYSINNQNKLIDLEVPGGQLVVNLENVLWPSLSGQTEFIYKVIIRG